MIGLWLKGSSRAQSSSRTQTVSGGRAFLSVSLSLCVFFTCVYTHTRTHISRVYIHTHMQLHTMHTCNFTYTAQTCRQECWFECAKTHTPVDTDGDMVSCSKTLHFPIINPSFLPKMWDSPCQFWGQVSGEVVHFSPGDTRESSR